MAKNKKFYKKIPGKKIKLPSNSRIITEKLINDHVVFFLGTVFIIAATVLVLFDFYSNFKKQEIIFSERKRIVNDLNFWNKEVIEKPNYRDGYFSLSLIYYQLGDNKNSWENLSKAMDIDPNFENGKELKRILEDR
jgi:tetratricopeptide (TPR) repeat protein